MKQVLGDTQGRLGTDELADLSNVDSETGEPITGVGPKAHIAKLSSFFHADLAYTHPRASWSLLKAHEIPPPGYGGNTVFADTRTAFEDLDEIEVGLKERLLSKEYVGVHSWQHALKTSNPDMFKDLDPYAYPMAKHRLVEIHQPSARVNLYIGLYLHHIEAAREGEGEVADLQHKLLQHATQAKYQLNIEWQNPGDMIIWDNRQVKSITLKTTVLCPKRILMIINRQNGHAQSRSGNIRWKVPEGFETCNSARHLDFLGAINERVVFSVVLGGI